MRPRPEPLLPLIPFNITTTIIILLVLAILVIVILAIFKRSLYNRLSTRITVLIVTCALVTLVILLAFNQITSDSLSPEWLRQLQIALIVLGGPVVIGLLAARFVRRPLRQFNEAIASMEKKDGKVQLQPTGIHEFDEVFAKFNNLARRLQHEESLRRDLVSDTSHELNTPLTVLTGQLTAIQDGKYTASKERIAILKEQAERLVDLVQQLEAYTKARTPNTEEREDIPLRQFCEELISHFNLELKEKGIDATVDIADDYTLHANRGGLGQILTNLIQNTIRYSEATELTITATKNTLTFSDNGKGVPSDSLQYLFERFYRVDKSRNRASGGLGLGLAIVKELTERQGWHIHAEQAKPGLLFVLKFE